MGRDSKGIGDTAVGSPPAEGAGSVVAAPPRSSTETRATREPVVSDTESDDSIDLAAQSRPTFDETRPGGYSGAQRPSTAPPPIPPRRTTENDPRPAAGPQWPRATTQPPELFSVHGVRIDLVGRDRELRQMVDVVERAGEFRAPQLITLVGNQGTGKTRLVDELVSRLPTSIRVYRGKARAHGPRFVAIARLLRDRLGVRDGTPEARVREILHRQAAEVFSDERIAEMLHFLGGYLDLRYPDSPFLRVLGETPQQNDEIARTVLRRFFEADAEQNPVVLVLDDLQWADDDTLKLLLDLGTHLSGAKIVLIACARPELMVRIADWGQGVTDHTRIDLRNLSREDAGMMFRALLTNCASVSADIVDDAVEMTGGNPYFLEQLVRLFHSNGTIDSAVEPWIIDAELASQTELPISVEEAIEGRIAALEGHERDLLEKGAVFGSVFWEGAVVALIRMDAVLQQDDGTVPGPMLEYDWSDTGDQTRRAVLATIDDLVERDYLLRLDPEDSTIRGDVEVVFKHNLERDLIAKSTEQARLQRNYRLAAQWLECKLSSRSEEQLEFLAQLYERGGDRVRAARCYLIGGDKARDRYAQEQAVQLYRCALRTLDGDLVARLQALHNLGCALDELGDTQGAQQQFALMLQQAWLLEQPAKGGAAHSQLGRIHRRLGDYEKAMENLRSAHDLFAVAGDRRGVAGALDDMGQVHWLRGGYSAALDHHRQALAIRRALGDQRSIALCLANIGRVHHDSGAFKAAGQQFREALELRRSIGDKNGVVDSLCDLGGLHGEVGQHEEAMRMFSEARQIAVQTGNRIAQVDVLIRLGDTTAVLGKAGEAVELLMEGISIAAELGYQAGLAECTRRLADVFLVMGDDEQAIDYAQRALRVAEKIGARAQIAMARRTLGECLAAPARGLESLAKSEKEFRAAIAILTGMNHDIELARCYRVFSTVRDRLGDTIEANKLRTRADEIYGRLRGAASAGP